MGAQRGKDLLLKIGDGGSPESFVTVAGLRARTISLNARTVDVTDGDSAGRWRELLAGAGVRSAAVSGQGKVDGVETVGGRKVRCDLLIVAIGVQPATSFLAGSGVPLDDDGYVLVDEQLRTGVPNVFAAGDITNGSNKFRQIITASAEGAIAANGVYKMLKLK